jgi:DNA-binding IclR family transcriptional regulator
LRKALFESRPLLKHTPRTIVDIAALETELDKIRQTRIGTDDEEFIEGMSAAAVPVMDTRGRICATVAVHGPTVRLPLQRAIALAPALLRAARAIEKTLRKRQGSQPPAATSR